MSRKAIPKKLEKLIYQESGMCCPMCSETDVSTFQIHHIQPYSEVKEHTFDNMILLCSSCHSKVTAGDIHEREIYKLKINLSNGNHPYINKDEKKDSNVINLSDYVVNEGIVANNVNVDLPKPPKIIQQPPDGAIASSLQHRNYVKYLIDRYHEFKLAEAGKNKMNYQIFYQTIKRQFGSKWDMIDLNRFDILTSYLQDRIDKTRLGRNRTKCYSSFDEYMQKHG